MSPFSIVLVWMEGESTSKCMHFHMKTYQCGHYLRIIAQHSTKGAITKQAICQVLLALIKWYHNFRKIGNMTLIYLLTVRDHAHKVPM